MDQEMKPVSSPETSSSGEKAVGIHACSTCNKSFSSFSNLKQHQKIHLDEKLFVCELCNITFSRKSSLKRHVLIHKRAEVFLKCDECGLEFSRKDNFQRHLYLHQNHKFPCRECDQVFHRKYHLRQHVRTQHKSTPLVTVKRKMTLPNVKSKRLKQQPEALNVFKTLMFYPHASDESDLEVFHTQLQPELHQSLQNEVRDKNSIKWYIVLKISLERTTANDDIEEIQTYFRSPCFIELTEDSINQHIQEGHAKIIQSFEEFTQRGSGWILKKIHHLELKIAKYHPLAASSYIPLPDKLKRKKAVLNIQNFNDAKCLVWCLLAYKLNLNGKKHLERVSHYIPHENLINLGNVECPVAIQKMPIIEKLNDLRINIFGYENDEVCPLYISPKEDEKVINLLLIGDGEKQHYCLINNFSRLLGDLTKHDGETYYCYRCLHRFTRKGLLKDHMQYCKNIQVIKMPSKEDSILYFKGAHYQHPVAYCIYADFESLLVPITSATPSAQSSYTEKLAYHVPCGYAYVIIGPDGRSIKPIQVYRGEDAVDHFLDKMMEEKETLGHKLLNIKPMHLSIEEEEAFQTAEICNVCKKLLHENRVRDHCHITGAYRGALHAECNLNYKLGKTIPVVFHNLKNYDGHHIMTRLGKFKDHTIEVIAQTLENYISFKVKKIESPIQMVFLDSFQFLPTSLEKLVKNLQLDQFSILKENFSADTPLTLLTRKGVFPYEYMTSQEKFNETQLPPPSAFFNSLTDQPIENDDYEHAKNIWNIFKMRNLGDFHDLYVKTDVLLLADVFENFRTLCQQYYEIDCAHLFTAPGLAWQACLKMCETPLELLTDIDMLLLIEKGIRGGISMISRRYARANNKYMTDYNPKLPSSYIMYWDANNLYGWAMSQYLPYGKFHWFSTHDITDEWILSLPDDGEEGYIFEIDLEYPEKLHDLHNDYPVAPERVLLTEEELSPYAKSLLNNRKYVASPKLIPNLKNKKNYVVHYRNVKFYLKLGLKITCVHKALKFKQAPWLRKYILFNTEKRKQATSSFEKDFFKLLNNSVYGKTMENLRKRRNIELCNSSKRAEKLVASPTFKSFKTYNEDLTAVERLKTSILMNRPIYVGFTILELSKLLMYDFHYNHIKRIYNDRATLLFTDTDSLTYHIFTEDIYQDMQMNSSLYDFSDYPNNHPLYSEENKKVIGKFKDELNGEIAIEFVGLKSKMYSIKSSKTEKKRAKGVSTQVVQHKIKHEDYLQCLRQMKTSTEKQTRIAQDDHNLFTINQNKTALSPFDDKRYITSDGLTSLAYGHYELRQHLAV